MARRGVRSNVPIASFAASQKSSGYFVISDEPPYSRLRQQHHSMFRTDLAGHLTCAVRLWRGRPANLKCTDRELACARPSPICHNRTRAPLQFVEPVKFDTGPGPYVYWAQQLQQNRQGTTPATPITPDAHDHKS